MFQRMSLELNNSPMLKVLIFILNHSQSNTDM